MKEEELDLDLSAAAGCSGMSVNGGAVQGITAQFEELLPDKAEDHAMVNGGIDDGIAEQRSGIHNPPSQPDPMVMDCSKSGVDLTSATSANGGVASIGVQMSSQSSDAVSLSTPAMVESNTLKWAPGSQQIENPKRLRFDPIPNPNIPQGQVLFLNISDHPTSFLVVQERDEHTISSFLQFTEQYVSSSRFRRIRLVRTGSANLFFIKTGDENDAKVVTRRLRDPRNVQKCKVFYIHDSNWHSLYPHEEAAKCALDALWEDVTPTPPQSRHQTTLRHRAGRKITAKRNEWGDDVDRFYVQPNPYRPGKKQSNSRTSYQGFPEERGSEWERKGPGHYERYRDSERERAGLGRYERYRDSEQERAGPSRYERYQDSERERAGPSRAGEGSKRSRSMYESLN